MRNDIHCIAIQSTTSIIYMHGDADIERENATI